MSTIQQPDLQQRTLRLYGELLSRRSDWSGQLALAAFPGAASTGLAAAASIAGAASLTVDSDSAMMKAHFRDGAFDFVVNTLDESLRALKNEIRRGRPIAIGLIADPIAALAEAADRGLAARMVVISAEPTPLEKSVVAAEGFLLPSSSASTVFTGWLQEKQWRAANLEHGNALPQFEKADSRQRWLQSLPKYQRSVAKNDRWLWLAKEA